MCLSVHKLSMQLNADALLYKKAAVKHNSGFLNSAKSFLFFYNGYGFWVCCSTVFIYLSYSYKILAAVFI